MIRVFNCGSLLKTESGRCMLRLYHARSETPVAQHVARKITHTPYLLHSKKLKLQSIKTSQFFTYPSYAP